MKNSPSNTEKKRLDELLAYGIMDTPPEEEFDSIVELAAAICKVPIAAISFVDVDRQWFKSRYGFDIPHIERNHSFCTHTIREEEIFIVKDAQDHALFQDSPFVAGRPGVRFYAGIPLRSHRGHALGALCVMDTEPADLDTSQRKALKVLGDQVARLLENRRINDNHGKTMDIQRHLLEWGKLQHSQTGGAGRPDGTQSDNRPIGSVELAGHLLETLRSFPCATRFSIVDMHKEFDPCPLPEQKLQFIMKCMLLWFCDVAEEGTIMIDELMVKDNTLMVKLQLHSRKFLPEFQGKIEKLTNSLYVTLAGDVLRKFHGDLWMKLSSDRLIVSFSMDLNVP